MGSIGLWYRKTVPRTLTADPSAAHNSVDSEATDTKFCRLSAHVHAIKAAEKSPQIYEYLMEI